MSISKSNPKSNGAYAIKADIFRDEKNIIDLYVMLLRFSSLITETIPLHREYEAYLQNERLFFRKKLLHVLDELEALKPDAQRRIEELNRKSRNQVGRWGQANQNSFTNNSLEWPSTKKQTSRNEVKQIYWVPGQDDSRGPINQHYRLPQSKPIDGQFHKLSLNIPRPKEETLSRHSILGPNGLHGHWQPPIPSRGIQYPSNLDLTPVDIPSLLQPTQDEHSTAKVNVASEHVKSALEEVLSLHDDGATVHAEEPTSLITFDIMETTPKMDIPREPSPPPVRAEVQDLAAITSEISYPTSGQTNSLEDVRTESPLQVHISAVLMDSFMRVAKSNTDRNLETCGVLAGSLKNRNFFVTALIIPKQESTSDSCSTTNEEEIFEFQDKQSLFTLGWIHTHPTQSCFMSSIDVHTHYSYQIMLPEAIAIVMAPRDGSRTHGIFRLTAPGGMSVIRQCQQRGFHPHPEPLDGGPIYDRCSDVYMNPKLKFDVVDLR
ncbi:AMSH-like ubiquitin thioesterase 1 isoform X2 [Asparagus officinalis]|uniref:AMSH-like ubiquitin thioesterase 1 isoform X2 n=1 Tax=Asparagus officinalis TaxID=4686 RepID=UPI00098DF1D2|nr:AMSH-like ubiquitin thioesterase 1 isoform X2 [Asparagus officinalis]